MPLYSLRTIYMRLTSPPPVGGPTVESHLRIQSHKFNHTSNCVIKP